MLANLRRAIGTPQPFPAEHRKNFIHLFFDIAWWGVLNGSIIVFLAVYASRLGASSLQIGLMTATPALVNLIFTFPASNFARGKSTHLVIRWAAFITRMFYALLIPLPMLLAPQPQIWTILVITLLMNVSGTMAAVMGNAFFAETVPVEWRGQVVGTRNALLALTSMVTAFVVGQILKAFPFETGYQIVFVIGWAGAMMSVFHLFLIKPVKSEQADNTPSSLTIESRSLVRIDIVRGPFLRVLLVMFFFHLAVFLPNPIFPLYQVRTLKLTDEIISLGTSLFFVIHFLASLQMGSLSRRLGFKTLTGVGTIVASIATLVFTFSFQTWIYLFCQIFSGIGWAMIGSGLINYLLDRVPPDDRPPHLAWFNIAVNVAVLLCGVIASPISSVLGIFGTMLLAIALRFVAGLVIIRWG